MKFLPSICNDFLDFCSRKRSRTSPKTENLIKLKRKRKLSVFYNNRSSTMQASSIFCESHIPTTSKNLYKELVSDPTSITNIRSLVYMLNDVHKKGDTYLNSCLKNSFSSKSQDIKYNTPLASKGHSKLQTFLNDHNIEDINADEIKSL